MPIAPLFLAGERIIERWHVHHGIETDLLRPAGFFDRVFRPRRRGTGGGHHFAVALVVEGFHLLPPLAVFQGPPFTIGAGRDNRVYLKLHQRPQVFAVGRFPEAATLVKWGWGAARTSRASFSRVSILMPRKGVPVFSGQCSVTYDCRPLFVCSSTNHHAALCRLTSSDRAQSQLGRALAGLPRLEVRTAIETGSGTGSRHRPLERFHLRW